MYVERDGQMVIINESWPESAEVRLLNQGDGDQYGLALRQAFSFFRRHADGRYSNNTIMRILTAADRWDERVANDERTYDNRLPNLAICVIPTTYDENTEVKNGGMVGVLVSWEDDSKRAIMAVHKNYRRKSIGTSLFIRMRYSVLNANWWVGRHNQTGQQFLLSIGLFPTAFNTSGAIRYSAAHSDGDE
jgi:GNAT superfamily N-acetyltransferase